MINREVFEYLEHLFLTRTWWNAAIAAYDKGGIF